MSISHLYNSLKDGCETKDLTIEQRDVFAKNIKDLDGKGQEMVYVLIKMFEMDETKITTDQLPYESKVVSKEIRLDLDKIPDKLKQMIFKFSNMHLKNMEEELRIVNERKILNV